MSDRKTLIVGLTGPTGAGKSTVARMFSARGAQVVDADVVARETIESSAACLADLVLAFSTEIIRPDATLNREKLAEICFSDKQKLKQLNEITFPHITKAIWGRIKEIEDAGVEIAVLDAPALIEAGLHKKCAVVVAVIAAQDLRMRRIIERDSMTQEAAQRRVSAQHPDSFYTAHANYILTNDGETEALRLAFLEVYDKLERLAAGDQPQPEDFVELETTEDA